MTNSDWENPVLDPIPGTEILPDNSNWLNSAGRQSRLAIALVDPKTFTVQHANDSFGELTGVTPNVGEWQGRELRLCDLFVDFDEVAQSQLYRRHLLRLILRDICQLDQGDWRFLDEPIVTALKCPPSPEPRYIEFWLRSNHLKVERIDPNLDEFAEGDLSELLERWEEGIQWSNYRVTGQLLWEGLDITAQERIQRLISLLLERESILQPENFAALGRQMRSLFSADRHLLLSVKGDLAQVLMGNSQDSSETIEYPLDALEGSHFLLAADANRVWNVPDLESDCPTELERMLRDRGTQSLLLIPLLKQDWQGEAPLSAAVLGLAAVGSDRANNFDRLDANRASALIPALKAALRQATQAQFTRIHPSVSWRFLQEAERRSLGKPPEQIVFKNVYPMYGISDVRGSAKERNQAIQTDLLEQFRLAIAIIEAASNQQNIGFLQQLKLDLLAYVDRLSEEVRVEDEVSAVDYLKNHLEVYFDYFRQCDTAIAAVEAYEQACANERGCVYRARDRYDRTLHAINAQLRGTWERWQEKMQNILPHYADIEVADGIDHIIYVGSSINPQFSLFHLHSLRYEQLRAVCDCARTCLKLHGEFDIPLEVSHLILVQETTVDIFHDEQTEKLFDVQGTRDTRYEIVKKRIDKGIDAKDRTRITQPGMLTVVYSTNEEWNEYHQYLRYLVREGWVDCKIESGTVEPLQGVTGLKFARVRILPDAPDGEGVGFS